MFEIVEGARLTGVTTPGATVLAALPLQSRSDGETRQYLGTTRAGEDGRFELDLPYSTDGAAPSNVVADGRYLVAVDVGRGPQPWLEVEMTEEQVQSGAALDLSPTGGGR